MDSLLEDVRLASQGDRDALERLLSHFHHSLGHELARHIDGQVRGAIEVEDVLQVTYLEAFLDIARYRPDTINSFQNWLRKIARNNLSDGLRALRAAKSPPFKKALSIWNDSDSYGSLVRTIAASDTTPTQFVSRAETERLVNEAISALPDDYAAVVRLYDLDRQPIDVVASAMNRRHGAIYMMRTRAHRRLAELLAPHVTGWGLNSSVGVTTKGGAI